MKISRVQASGKNVEALPFYVMVFLFFIVIFTGWGRWKGCKLLTKKPNSKIFTEIYSEPNVSTMTHDTASGDPENMCPQGGWLTAWFYVF